MSSNKLVKLLHLVGYLNRMVMRGLANIKFSGDCFGTGHNNTELQKNDARSAINCTLAYYCTEA